MHKFISDCSVDGYDGNINAKGCVENGDSLSFDIVRQEEAGEASKRAYFRRRTTTALPLYITTCNE